jgi:peptide/nickel transport system permease protein
MLSPGASELHGVAKALDLLHHLTLPALCLGLVASAGTARWLRSAFLDARSQPHVLAARARGIPERRILWVHTVRPAILPLITQIGLSLPLLVSGAVAIEVVFSWPGMGQLAWRAATARDVPLVLATTLVGTAAAVAGNLLADLLYGWADPRAREAP